MDGKGTGRCLHLTIKSVSKRPALSFLLLFSLYFVREKQRFLSLTLPFCSALRSYQKISRQSLWVLRRWALFFLFNAYSFFLISWRNAGFWGLFFQISWFGKDRRIKAEGLCFRRFQEKCGLFLLNCGDFGGSERLNVGFEVESRIICRCCWFGESLKGSRWWRRLLELVWRTISP